MKCMFCGSQTRVINSRRQVRSNSVWRRRKCRKCSAVFTSIESPDLASTLMVDKAGSYSPFLADLLYTEVLLAISDRKDCYSASRELTNSIIRGLTRGKRTTFTPQQITKETSKVLRRFSKRAWMRYSAEHESLLVKTKLT